VIIDLDPYFVSPSSSFTRTDNQPPTFHPASHASHRGLNRSRTARESSFERNHGSLWEPGLLDRLTAPLTRIHE
jgi:hypothetical protein